MILPKFVSLFCWHAVLTAAVPPPEVKPGHAAVAPTVPHNNAVAQPPPVQATGTTKEPPRQGAPITGQTGSKVTKPEPKANPPPPIAKAPVPKVPPNGPPATGKGFGDSKLQVPAGKPPVTPSNVLHTMPARGSTTTLTGSTQSKIRTATNPGDKQPLTKPVDTKTVPPKVLPESKVATPPAITDKRVLTPGASSKGTIPVKEIKAVNPVQSGNTRAPAPVVPPAGKGQPTVGNKPPIEGSKSPASSKDTVSALRTAKTPTSPSGNTAADAALRRLENAPGDKASLPVKSKLAGSSGAPSQSGTQKAIPKPPPISASTAVNPKTITGLSKGSTDKTRSSLTASKLDKSQIPASSSTGAKGRPAAGVSKGPIDKTRSTLTDNKLEKSQTPVSSKVDGKGKAVTGLSKGPTDKTRNSLTENKLEKPLGQTTPLKVGSGTSPGNGQSTRKDTTPKKGTNPSTSSNLKDQKLSTGSKSASGTSGQDRKTKGADPLSASKASGVTPKAAKSPFEASKTSTGSGSGSGSVVSSKSVPGTDTKTLTDQQRRNDAAVADLTTKDKALEAKTTALEQKDQQLQTDLKATQAQLFDANVRITQQNRELKNIEALTQDQASRLDNLRVKFDAGQSLSVRDRSDLNYLNSQQSSYINRLLSGANLDSTQRYNFNQYVSGYNSRSAFDSAQQQQFNQLFAGSGLSSAQLGELSRFAQDGSLYNIQQNLGGNVFNDYTSFVSLNRRFYDSLNSDQQAAYANLENQELSLLSRQTGLASTVTPSNYESQYGAYQTLQNDIAQINRDAQAIMPNFSSPSPIPFPSQDQVTSGFSSYGGSIVDTSANYANTGPAADPNSYVTTSTSSVPFARVSSNTAVDALLSDCQKLILDMQTADRGGVLDRTTFNARLAQLDSTLQRIQATGDKRGDNLRLDVKLFNGATDQQIATGLQALANDLVQIFG